MSQKDFCAFLSESAAVRQTNPLEVYFFKIYSQEISWSVSAQDWTPYSCFIDFSGALLQHVCLFQWKYRFSRIVEPFILGFFDSTEHPTLLQSIADCWLLVFRLPLFQASAFAFLAPAKAILSLDKWKCNNTGKSSDLKLWWVYFWLSCTCSHCWRLQRHQNREWLK